MVGAPLVGSAAAAAVLAVVRMLEGTADAQAPSDCLFEGKRFRFGMVFSGFVA